MALTGQRLTAEEFLAIPEGEGHYQLIDGEIVVSEPRWAHQRAVGLIHARILAWTESGPGRGTVGLPVDTHLDDRNVYAPDVWWLADDHRSRLDAGYLIGPPDLVVEVRSPSTWRYDRGTKRQVYERTGLAELWLVDPAAAIVVVHRRSGPTAGGFDVTVELGRADQFASPLLPGFALPVASIVEQ